MKKFLILFLCAIFAHPAFGLIKTVTNLSSSTPTLIVTPGSTARVIYIKNTGLTAVMISLDGGTAHGGNNPTTSAGWELLPGEKIVINSISGNDANGDAGLHNPIYAIAESGTGTLVIVTDDTHSI